MSASGQAGERPRVGLSLMTEPAFLKAVYPLFAGGDVDVVEWSFDMGWDQQPLPAWADSLLSEFAETGWLLGHGVSFSVLAAADTPRQQAWLDRLRRDCATHAYRHVSEHFGFMSGGNFHRAAPLPVPLTPAALALGRQRLQRLRDVVECPVGLENLAFAFGRDDVRAQGAFLEQLLAPVDGFLLLDLHNLYCQCCNFGVPADELLASLPLQRVRELHVSGGSWQRVPSASEQPVRRDTHDERVPDNVFALVPTALDRCPAVAAVILECVGTAPYLADHGGDGFRQDFHRLATVVGKWADSRSVAGGPGA
jgi:uncharacterized protein (UPF0276 family)